MAACKWRFAPGQQLEAARFQQIVSRRLSTAAQLAALTASATMFVLGPGVGFFPH